MVEGGGMKCIKCFIVAFNFVLVVVACGLIGIGIYKQVDLADHFDFVGNPVPATDSTTLLIVIGIITFIVATFGCFSTLKENYCCIMTFAVLLGVIVMTQVAAGTLLLHVSDRNRVPNERAALWNGVKPNYGKTGHGDVTAAWDKLQHKVWCCGVSVYTEWYSILTPKLVPTSCCIDPESTQCENRTPTLNAIDFHIQGCQDKLREWITTDTDFVGFGSIGLSIVQVVDIIIVCCFGKAIRKEYKVL